MVYFLDRLFDAFSKGDALFMQAVMYLIQKHHLTALFAGVDGVLLVGVLRFLEISNKAVALGIFVGRRPYLTPVDEPLVFLHKLQRHHHLLDDETSV